jgi:hypothetical protein
MGIVGKVVDRLSLGERRRDAKACKSKDERERKIEIEKKRNYQLFIYYGNV